jgi:pimeloyl-ACP methyl ester carboxylesterase
MTKIKIGNVELNYESYGSGEPLVFLNGIMMSTASWRPFINSFPGYNLIFVDLVDQGLSSKAEGPYTQNMHVDMLKELFVKLNFEKVHLMGISYGGEVAMRFALAYPEMLESLILSNTTSYTNEIMKDIEDSWDYAASTYNGTVFFKLTMPYIYSHKFYEENTEWLRKREEALNFALTAEWYEGFRRAIRSASDLNITRELHKINIPTLIIGSDLDVITPIKYQEVIHKEIPGSKMLIIKDAGHASMYEKPYEFAACINGFLNVYRSRILIS